MDVPILYKMRVGEPPLYAITRGGDIYLYTLSSDPYCCWSIFMKERPWWHRFMWFNEIRDYYRSIGYSHQQINIEINNKKGE